MRRFLTLLALVFLLVPLVEALDWQMLYPRVNHGAIVSGSYVIVIGGDNGQSHGSQVFYNNGEVLDKYTGENMGEFSLQGPANFPILTEVAGQIYFFISDGMGVTVRRLNVNPFLGEDIGFIAPAALYIHSRGAICPDPDSGRVYFVSGSEAVGGHNLCEYFDVATGLWMEIASLPITGDYVGRQAGFAQMDEGFLKFAGGYTCNSSGSDMVIHRDEYWYHHDTDTWTIVTPMQEARMVLAGAGGYWTAGQDVIPAPTGTPGRPPEPPQIVYQGSSEKYGVLLDDPITGRVGHISYRLDNLLITGGGGGPPYPLPVEIQDITGRRGGRNVPIEPAIGAVLVLDHATGNFYWIGGMRENGSRELECSTAVDRFSLNSIYLPATGPSGLGVLLLVLSLLMLPALRRR